MKRTFLRRFLGVILALALVVGGLPLGAITASAAAPTSYTNINLDEAKYVSASSREGGSYLRFVPTVGGTYEIASYNRTGDPYVYLLDYAGNELAYDDDDDGDRNFRLSHRLEAGNTYYIKACAYGSSGATYYFEINAIELDAVITPTPEVSADVWDGTIATGFDGGSGTSSNPYLINTAEQLAYLAYSVNGGTTYSGKYFKLTNNIDLANLEWTPIGKGVFDGDSAVSAYAFKGNFDGNNKIIYNLHINNTSTSTSGLFGLTVGGKIENLGVNTANITAYSADYRSKSGALIGCASGTTVEKCFAVNVDITTSTEANPASIGCLIGLLHGLTTVSDCYAQGDAYGINGHVAVLVGGEYSTGTTTIERCYAIGTAQAMEHPDTTVVVAAGILGFKNAPSTIYIEDSFFVGEITSEERLGVIVGTEQETVSTVSNCYYNVASSIQDPNGSYTSIANLTSQSWITTNLGWDFDTVWEMGEEHPVLRGFNNVELEPTPEPEPEPELSEDVHVEYNSSTGDLFLGGKYIELGISRHGSFGTSTAPVSSDFHTSLGDELGFVVDLDGWDIGEAPTTGDFFLPGSPEERYILAYDYNGTKYEYIVAERENIYSGNWQTEPTVRDASYGTTLRAIVSGKTTHGVEIEIVYSFGVNDKFFKTEFSVVNNGSREITDIRFVRNVDPDQDYYTKNSHYTHNKVICNPTSSRPGGEDNCAMVVAVGEYTYMPFYLIAKDNRARASLGVEFSLSSAYRSGLWSETHSYANAPTTSSLAYPGTGYSRDDVTVAMTFALGTLGIGASTQGVYYSGVTANVTDSAPTPPHTEHVYDNACDTTCNVCGAYRVAPAHTGFEITPLWELSNDSSYPFSYDGTTFSSTNHSDSTSSTFTITALAEFSLDLSYRVSSESGYDYLKIRQNGTQHVSVSGETSWADISMSLEAGDTITITYSKDGSVSNNDDTAYFMILTETTTCDQSFICSYCGETVREAAAHVYDTDTDASCNVCGAWRQVEDGHSCWYDNGCDEYCNECGAWRETYGHIYDDEGDEYCNECGEYRDVHLHYCWYDSECDEYCNECGMWRETYESHTYTDCYDSECDRCNCWRETYGHVYDDDWDEYCNECGEWREVYVHSCWFDSDCDEVCNDCGMSRIPETAHVYDNCNDSECNACYQWRETYGHEYFGPCDESCNVCGEYREVEHSYSGEYDTECDTCFYTRYIEGETVYQDGLTFNIEPDWAGGKAILTDCSTELTGEVIIPSTVMGSEVIAIAERTFWDCALITSIYIPDTVSEIFVPSGITAATSLVFFGCSSLESIIVDNMNENYTSMDGVLFNKNQTQLIQYPSAKADSNYEIPGTVTDIVLSAFAFASNLNSVTVPASVTSIGDGAFAAAPRLSAINVEDGNLNYSDIDGVLLNKDATRLLAYPTGKADVRYAVPTSVNIISKSAFAYSIVKELVLPKTVTNIGMGVFLNCVNLTDVYYSGTSAEKAKIAISLGNDSLHAATWHYESCTVAPEHTYYNNCDTDCNVCGFIREVGDHVYDNACDADCNECADTRTVGDHVYDNACDASCNECGAERAVGEHIYSNACDVDCNICGAIRVVDGHVFSNACDSDCNICGAGRTVGDHVYDNACDTDCNICGAVRAATGHVYTNGCDNTCNNCGSERITEHVYDNACDAYCNVCGANRPVGEHIYDNMYDSTCNECGAKREVETCPTFTVDNTSAQAGDIISVDVKIKNNTGICSFMLDVLYDSNVLELVSAEGKAFAGTSFGPTNANPFRISWVDALAENSTNGVVATLTFKVKEDAPLGKSDITLVYDENNVYDFEFENVYFAVENGSVDVIEYVNGDVNDDGVVNNKDIGLLQRYINGWGTEVNEAACDVTGDNVINNKDIGILQRYINGWDVELK